MLPTKYSIKFHLYCRNKRKKTDGTNTIRMSVTWRRHRVLLYLPVSVYENQWDKKAMKVRRTRKQKDVDSINALLDNYRYKVMELFDKAAREERIPTEDEVLSSISIIEKEAHSIPETIDEFIRNQSQERGWAPATKTKFYSLRHDLLCAGLKNVEDCNGRGTQKFFDFLYTRKHENAVLMKKASVSRWFLGWCCKKGYLNNDEYKLHQPHLKCPPKQVRFLTWEELMRLYRADFGNKQSLDTARDIFCFCAFTGLRYSDAKNLKWADVKEDHISIVTQKTWDSLIIELNKYSLSVLIKQQNKQGTIEPTRHVFPRMSIEKCNKQIKECAKLAEINAPFHLISYRWPDQIEQIVEKWEIVTTHCARRTFVVNALRFGIPAEVIMKWTGHSDFSAMKPYVDIVDDVKKENMAKFGATELIKNDIQTTVFQQSIK